MNNTASNVKCRSCGAAVPLQVLVQISLLGLSVETYRARWVVWLSAVSTRQLCQNDPADPPRGLDGLEDCSHHNMIVLAA